MKIAYYAYWDTERDDGVVKKIVRQITAWQAAGHEVRLFLISRTERVSHLLSTVPLTTEVMRSKLDLLLFSPRRLADRVLAWQPDLTYIRFAKYYPGMGRLMNAAPTVLEINTYDIADIRVKSSPLARLYHLLTRGVLLRTAAGYCFLSKEISQRFDKYYKPSITIGDSVELADYPVTQAPKNTQPRLVFMASKMAAWIGFDKVLELARLTPEWRYDIIGVAENMHIQLSNVFFHGFLLKEKYQPLLQMADIAIGSLALHRIGISEIAPLKTREYLAYGLPCIIGYKDSDFPTGAAFLLQLPNQENNIEPCIDEIKAFAQRWTGLRVPRAEINHLDVEVKERRRVEFFQGIAKVDRNAS